ADEAGRGDPGLRHRAGHDRDDDAADAREQQGRGQDQGCRRLCRQPDVPHFPQRGGAPGRGGRGDARGYRHRVQAWARPPDGAVRADGRDHLQAVPAGRRDPVRILWRAVPAAGSAEAAGARRLHRRPQRAGLAQVRLGGAVVVVTGAAQGIGAALCERFRREGARAVIGADINPANGALRCDVSREADIVGLIDDTEARFGPIDLFCSNAGIAVLDPDWDNPASAPTDGWMRSWAVNVMAHVHAARHLVPRMSVRGGGYFLNTVSAAGLLSQIGGGPYATTKHAALGFAENLAIATRDRGIKVSVLCP